MYLPSFAECTVATAALALAVLLGSAENALTILDSPRNPEARPLAEETAPAVWRVGRGTTTPPESVVPTIVVVIGPLGPVLMMVVVMTGGRGNWDDGKGLVVAGDVWLNVGSEVWRIGGCVGKEMLGNPG